MRLISEARAREKRHDLLATSVMMAIAIAGLTLGFLDQIAALLSRLHEWLRGIR
jgi:hypothetical protein